MRELNCPILKLFVLWCESVSASALASNPIHTKHIEINILFVRDKVIAKELFVCCVPSYK